MSEYYVHPIRSHFLDSGAFSLRKENPGMYDYMAYMDKYANFIRVNQKAIDLYANVDHIGEAKYTWDHQQYLENECGMKPVPVVHFGTDLKWLKHYIDRGYDLIGLGGLVGRTRIATGWLDRCFALTCGGYGGIPRVKLHGFGIVNHRLLVRYPWYSVDSSAWVKEGGRWGCIFVPHKRGGKFVFDLPPHKVIFAEAAAGSKTVCGAGMRNPHYLQLSKAERSIVGEWLEEINIPMGKQGVNGAVNHYRIRYLANIHYFERLRSSLPAYPSPLRAKVRGGTPFKGTGEAPKERMRIYYSGTAAGDSFAESPEVVLGRKACIMLTYYELPNKRFDRILKARRLNRPVKVVTRPKKEKEHANQ